MNFNLTLVGQTLAFMVFVWFCSKYIWPPLIGALEQRRNKIAEGLAAAEEGVLAREQAKANVAQQLSEARLQAKDIIVNAHRRADGIVEEAKVSARGEGDKIIITAKSEIEHQINRAREELRIEVVTLALAGAEQVLMREVDQKAHTEVLGRLAARL